MPAPQPIACHRCGHVWSFEPPLGRRDECPGCGADAKVCLNCRLYDKGAHHGCRESQAEWVKEKGKGNFCGYFEAKADRAAGGGDDAKKRLEALFSGAAKVESEEPSLKGELEKFLSSRK